MMIGRSDSWALCISASSTDAPQRRSWPIGSIRSIRTIAFVMFSRPAPLAETSTLPTIRHAYSALPAAVTRGAESGGLNDRRPFCATEVWRPSSSETEATASATSDRPPSSGVLLRVDRLEAGWLQLDRAVVDLEVVRDALLEFA